MDTSTGKAKGLESSIWAQSQSFARPYHDPKRFHNARARSYTPPPVTHSTADATASGPITSTSRGAGAGAGSGPGTLALSPLQIFQRFEQACQRLRWKFIDLQSSYVRATNPEDAGFSPADAERNFKVDFHEFYAWIEQALVLVLRIFGVAVARGEGPTRGAANHMYHHNVLSALDAEENPLHAVLGVGDVHHALWKAKELRNRWKDAAEGKETPPLKMYDLSWVVGQILAGLELAYGLAAEKTLADMASAAAKAGPQDASNGQVSLAEAGDESWDWMVEAMDWES